jgi:hypothetical protein
MKKQLFLCVFFGLLLSTAASAQLKEANASDVRSLDSIMAATYDSISGDAGQTRDWDRFRSLFYKDARLIPTNKNKEGVVTVATFTPDEYIKRAEPFLMKGFFEREIARQVVIYGNIAHVFSTYESRHKKDDKTSFARGINSFQLLNDGKRWWVVTIYWQAETPGNPIPKEFLKSRSSKAN